MVHFRNIDEDNFDAIVRMELPQGQRFVASNAYSLAQCWLYRAQDDVFPAAIYCKDTPVGFFLAEIDREEQEFILWRIMISPEHQGKGCAKAAVELALEQARQSGKFTHATLEVDAANTAAAHIYEKAGFFYTGEISHGSRVMRLDF